MFSHETQKLSTKSIIQWVDDVEHSNCSHNTIIHKCLFTNQLCYPTVLIMDCFMDMDITINIFQKIVLFRIASLSELCRFIVLPRAFIS